MCVVQIICTIFFTHGVVYTTYDYVRFLDLLVIGHCKVLITSSLLRPLIGWLELKSYEIATTEGAYSTMIISQTPTVP